MKKMYSDNEIREMLSTPVKESVVIEAKIQETYELIRKNSGKNKSAVQKSGKDNKWKTGKKFLYSIVSATAVVVFVFIVALSNPVWAANLPIIGGIFEKIQEIWHYGSVPEEEINGLVTEVEEVNGLQEEIYPYQLSANGIIVKLTEYYATNEAVFLGMKIESEKAFPGFYKPEENNLSVQLFATAEVSYDTEVLNAGDGYLKGVQTDEHTFEGVLRMDLRNKEIPKHFEMNLMLSNGYLYFVNLDKTGLRKEAFKIEGVIENIPISISDAEEKVIEINEVNELGIGIERIKISPVELIIYPINENDLEELLTFEVALDAEGRKLEWGYNDGIGFKTVHAIKGRDISTITVYSCEWNTYMNIKGLALEEDPELFRNALEEHALYKKVIETGIE